MEEILKIGKGLYNPHFPSLEKGGVGGFETYFLGNLEKVSREEERNKKKIDGFTRIFRDGRTRKFKYKR